MEKQIILLAGGSGLIGKRLGRYLRKQGHEVRVLTRGNTDPSEFAFHWNPAAKEIDSEALRDISVIINLSGAGIADKRWTTSRKQELIRSRVEPALFLASLAGEMPSLRHYISASGVNCYDTRFRERQYTEEDAYASDFLSQVVQQWEAAADAFQPVCKVAKVRISAVLTETGGFLETVAKPVRWGIGSPLGSGKQWMPWIHWMDLVRIFEFIMERRLEGSFNASGEVVTNREFTEILAKNLNKSLWAPKVPAFVLTLLLGEMASLALEGVNVSSEKLKSGGFEFQYETLGSAMEDLLK